ncbi:MAG: hypothetical protein KAI66_14655 [Lentisphaeria bacterium]|nr:hypothetical protein [Lentisphaeria bacterium]
MNNPYQSLDWRTAIRVPSTPHMHISAPWEDPSLSAQLRLDNAYRHGLRHFPISNYYPSAPCLASTRLSDFRLRQPWGTTRHGVPVSPPVNWNDLITWGDELAEDCREQLPFTESELLFPHVPADTILSKNAEHHSFTNSSCHITCPGSALCSGNFDARSLFRLREHGYPMGYNGTWQSGFSDMIDHLDFPDGGGIVVAHPTWSRLTDAEVVEMLSFDTRVLGMEIYNDGVGTGIREGRYPAEEGEPEPGFSIHMWDRILAEGRRCLGFCVPDHNIPEQGDWLGRIILMVPAFTERCCLQAYRKGHFYGCLQGKNLTVTDFAATPRRISVSVNTAAVIRFVTDAGLALSVEGCSATYEIPEKGGVPDVTYVRVEVEDDSRERLLLQPVMYRGPDGRPLP